MNNDTSCTNCYFNQDGICQDFDGLYFLKEATYHCPDFLSNDREYSFIELLNHLEKGGTDG